jgi:hypothetical protein
MSFIVPLEYIEIVSTKVIEKEDNKEIIFYFKLFSIFIQWKPCYLNEL